MSFMEIYDKISFLLYLVIAELFICHRYGMKKHGIIRLFLGLVPSVLIMFFWQELIAFVRIPQSIWVPVSRYFIAFILTLPALAISYKGNFWSILFAGILAYCLQHISYQTFSLIRHNGASAFPFLDSEWVQVPIFVGELLIVYVFFLRKQKKNEPIVVNNRVQVLLTALILILVVYTSFFGVIHAARSGDSQLFNVVLLYSICSGVLGAALEISLVTIRRQEIEAAILKQMVHQAKYQFQMSKDNIELINVKCHDLRHQIRNLSGRVDKEELEEMEKAVAIYDASLCTGNDALDIILMEKELQCREANIRLTSMFDAQVIRFMKDSDIYSLFGNIIENAMDSVRNLDPEKRSISLSGYYQAGWNVIRVENYVEGEVIFKDGLPVTKRSSDYHGFGVKSIQLIVEKYNGYFSFRQSGDIFRLEILFPGE